MRSEGEDDDTDSQNFIEVRTSSMKKTFYPIQIISKYGLTTHSTMFFDSDDEEIGSFPMIYWRNPKPLLGCEIDMIEAVTPSPIENCLILSLDPSFDLQIKFKSKEDFETVYFILETHITSFKESQQNLSKTPTLQPPQSHRNLNFTTSHVLAQQYFALRVSECQIAVKQEQVIQLSLFLKFKEGLSKLGRITQKSTTQMLTGALNSWKSFTRQINNIKMEVDKCRWRLHAAANQDRDLQAWYHAVFFEEVYRLRGPFWYRDAVLPQYRQNYDLVDSGMSPHEEAALAHVLCSPDTTYGDVAAQMFVVQGICGSLPGVSSENHELEAEAVEALLQQGRKEYDLFERLASLGVQVTKHPRSGRPAKKPFRVSFVEGHLYLTWKGKNGNQGVDLAEVSGLTTGLGTDILRKSGSSSKALQYLSLHCEGRSIDLQLETEEDRLVWEGLLQKMIKKEHGELEGFPISLPIDTDLLSWGLRFSSLGVLPPPEIIHTLLSFEWTKRSIPSHDIK